MMPHSDVQNNGRRRRTGNRDALKQSLSIPLFRGDSSNSSSRANSSHGNSSAEPSRQNTPTNLHSMLEPAIDGPPSPERLRQLSKQMKRASHLNRSMGHRSPSGSPAPRSAAEHPPWEQALADMSLNRRPSNRSISSSIPSKERPDSVQALGKDLFRRTKIKRASSSYSSSNSSMYSAEVPNDGHLNKDSLIPTIFARRKPSRDESAAEKKLQISGPFNFQHVAHTQRDNVPHMRIGSQGEVTDEFAQLPTPAPATAPGNLQIDAQDLPYPGYSNGEYDEFDEMAFSAPPTRPGLYSHHTAPTSAPRRRIKQAKSQDQLRSMFPFEGGAPGRKTRSPSEANVPVAVPPPRRSSRPSLSGEGFSAFVDGSLDRAQANAPRQPQPYDPAESMEEPPPEFLDEFSVAADLEAFSFDERRPSHALTTAEEVSWPLAAPAVVPPGPSPFDKGLPDVPEEEESQQFHQQQQQQQQRGHSHHKSKASLASNSSLRGSQSVPALRRLSQNRRMSGASDTLGHYDMAAAHRATRADQMDDADIDPLSTLDNWEDDIDYCYEHEADANFDYNWERSSLDVQRGEARPPVKVIFEDDELAEMKPAQPVGRTDGGVPQSDSLGVTNFSFPRGDKGSRASQLRAIRPVSYASTFKESHGFNLSPSLLIPSDYTEMMGGEHDQYGPHDEVFREAYQGPYNTEDASPFKMNKSPLSYAQRSSTSTTGSATSSHFDSVGERHTSTNSNFTALTRFTVSSTSSSSLNKVAGSVTGSKDLIPVTTFIDTNDDSDSENEVEEEQEEEATPPACDDTVPELTSFPAMASANKKLSLHKSHASESLPARNETGAPMRSSQDAAKMRRPRARTSSLSAPVPPVGQYALFPRGYAKDSKPTGDNRI